VANLKEIVEEIDQRILGCDGARDRGLPWGEEAKRLAFDIQRHWPALKAALAPATERAYERRTSDAQRRGWLTSPESFEDDVRRDIIVDLEAAEHALRAALARIAQVEAERDEARDAAGAAGTSERSWIVRAGDLEAELAAAREMHAAVCKDLDSLSEWRFQKERLEARAESAERERDQERAAQATAEPIIRKAVNVLDEIAGRREPGWTLAEILADNLRPLLPVSAPCPPNAGATEAGDA
jgi:hypothetical protein